MKRLAGLLLAALLAFQAQAQPRTYHQGELDALLAPVALYPDALLTQILEAATFPEDVAAAAAWSRANAHLRGDEALRAVEPMPWHPSVKALVAFPDLLARMGESPQWLADLGEAYYYQEPHVLDTVQALRQRAQAAGSLQSDAYRQVVQYPNAIAVQPLHPQVIYVPYYDPFRVYGTWWWPAYRPVAWRPWHPAPTVVVTRVFVTQQPLAKRPYAHRRLEHAPPPHFHNHVHQAQRARPIIQAAPLPAQPHRHEPRQPHRQEARHPHRQPLGAEGHRHFRTEASPRPRAEGHPRMRAEGHPRLRAEGRGPNIR